MRSWLLLAGGHDQRARRGTPDRRDRELGLIVDSQAEPEPRFDLSRVGLSGAELQPGPQERILRQLDPRNYAQRHFVKVCGAAELPRHTPKDLRDTFASQLITAGIQLSYVTEQLGHADQSVTARHYARWVAGDAYRRPLEVAEGQVPADLIATLSEAVESAGEKEPSVAGPL